MANRSKAKMNVRKCLSFTSTQHIISGVVIYKSMAFGLVAPPKYAPSGSGPSKQTKQVEALHPPSDYKTERSLKQKILMEKEEYSSLLEHVDVTNRQVYNFLITFSESNSIKLLLTSL